MLGLDAGQDGVHVLGGIFDVFYANGTAEEERFIGVRVVGGHDTRAWS